MKINPVVLILALLLPFHNADAQAATIYFVRTNGNDALPGTSWADAKATVSAAIAAAAAGHEIWVARGAYSGPLTLKPDLALYGGFAGDETARDQRNWSTNLSLLWGTPGQAVVTVTNAGHATRLDGFTVGGGTAIHGGGIKTVGAGPVIANNTIRNNITDGLGGGVSVWYYYLTGTNVQFPVITNNVIVENQAINDEGDGAGIGVYFSSPLVVRNIIARNTATRNGGGIASWRDGRAVIANNFILANSASYDELTLSLGGGGIFASATDVDGRPMPGEVSAPLIVNNVIAANGADGGGGIAVVDSLLGAANIRNNTIAANNGAGIYWANTAPTNDNNIVAFNAWGFERGPAGSLDAVVRTNDVFGNGVFASHNYRNTPDRTGALGNVSADPLLANPAIGDFHLQPGSPCIAAGWNAAVVTDWGDIDSQARVQGGAVDLGADESDGTTWNTAVPVVFVSPNGSDTDGLSWATAKRSVTNGIALAAQTGGEVWVARGRYVEHPVLPAFVQLYGGFAGTETSRTARDPAANPSVLDGGGTAPVVYFKNAGCRVSVLDGFTVQGGGTYFQVGAGGRGGGIYCRVSGPVIANSLIHSNSLGSPIITAEAYGGGAYCYLSHAVITNNTFQLNDVLSKDGKGGGLYCTRSRPLVADNLFRTNRARIGSAIYAWVSEPHVLGNRIEDNWFYQPSPYDGSVNGAVTLEGAPDALLQGNLIRRNTATFGGGVCLQSCVGVRVLNNVIADNLAWDPSGFGSGGQGGGLYCNFNVNASGQTVIANNTIAGNNAPPTFLGHFGGGAALTLLTNGIGLVFANNIVVSNSSGLWRYPYVTHQPVLRNNCVNNTNANYLHLSAGAGDIQVDPRFVSRAAGDFHLLSGSPCIDSGTPTNAPAADFDAVARPLDGNANGAAAFDLGAFEFVHPLADTDGDRMADAAELIAGTDPTLPASVLRATIRLVSPTGPLAVSWPSVLGRTYWVEAAPALTNVASWQTISNNIPATGGVLEIQDAIGPSNRFYSVGVSRP
jgi:hypothetical protein